MHGKCLFAAVCVLLTAALAVAQETTTGSIAGRVVDAQDLAVPGATVTVITPQGPRTFTSDSSGAFFAPFLTPGTYEVKVELQGFRTFDRQNVEVRLGQRVELTLPLQVGDLTESVNVTGAAPVVDTSSTTTGAVIDSEMIQRLPVGRRFSDTLYLAPGVSSGGQVGEANPSMSGGSGLENQYVVDGVNITATGDGQKLALPLGARILNGDLALGPELRFVPPRRGNLLLHLPPWRALANLMAWSLEHMPSALLRPFVMSFVTTALAPSPALFADGAILVNADGKRFTNETDAPAFALPDQPRKEAFILLDARIAARAG